MTNNRHLSTVNKNNETSFTCIHRGNQQTYSMINDQWWLMMTNDGSEWLFAGDASDHIVNHVWFMIMTLDEDCDQQECVLMLDDSYFLGRDQRFMVD